MDYMKMLTTLQTLYARNLFQLQMSSQMKDQLKWSPPCHMWKQYFYSMNLANTESGQKHQSEPSFTYCSILARLVWEAFIFNFELNWDLKSPIWSI